MMIITECVLLFLAAFLCFFVPYRLLQGSDDKDDYNIILKKRIDTLSKQQDELLESSGEHISTFVKLENDDFGEQDSTDTKGMVNKIALIKKKAGITDISLNTFMLVCTIGGIAFAALIIHFDFLHWLTGGPLGFCVGAFLVYNFLASQAEKRKMLFLEQFPDVIDMMIRGVKAGLNINRIVKLVSMEAKDPIAEEYRTISQKFDLGVEPEKVLIEAADKVNIEEFRFLVVALVLQMENGGVLGEILANLAGLVRKRLELGLKLKAMSAEARMSAIVISALPFVFAGIMMLVNPNHLKEFTKPGSGQTLLKITVTLFSIGTFFMLKATIIKV
jgi:Flp pilus assembly protein TadB